ncbi:MAG: HAMP domain-containing protein [Acidobacteria bacterium]|nr:HAMP domain-containing protein [Acidobacteriota bacterium]
MSGTERIPFARSLGFRLTSLLVAGIVSVLLLLGWSVVGVHRGNLERASLGSAERISDVIKRSTSYDMLRNDREGLYHMIGTIADEPGIVRIRIFNQEGRISFSTDGPEVGSLVDKSGEACYGCHARSSPLAKLDRPDRFRIYTLASGERALGVISPIENSPSCSEAACHAHPADQRILGVLDTDLSLAPADAALRAGTRRIVLSTFVAVTIVCLVSGFFVFKLINRPVRDLKRATERVASGDLAHEIEVRSVDELSDLAASFNAMTRDLRGAREESAAWARTLESKVRTKTAELQGAHAHLVQIEKMASIGKLSAVVAHEINNPLAGILTYAKLLGRRMDRGDWGEGRRLEARDSLRLIEQESQRCGEIVKNLLVFARQAPLYTAWSDLNPVVERCLRLVEQSMEMKGIQGRLELDPDLPKAFCDPSQIEQVVIALVVNAIEAMPAGGALEITTRARAAAGEIDLEVRDDGPGIPGEILPHVFEPFFTTKERGHGSGLGLAVSHGIVQRHGGRIAIVSDPAAGTVFTVTLPIGGAFAREAPAPDAMSTTYVTERDRAEVRT